MLPTILQNQQLKNIYRFLLFMSLAIMVSPIYAQTASMGGAIASVGASGVSTNTLSGVNAQTMVENVIANIPNLMRFITALAYVMGMYFIISGVMKLKQFGESRTMMSHEHSLKGPVIYLIVGTLLLYLPSSVQVGMSTFWTVPCPYCYMQQQDQWSEFISNAFLVMQLFGIIAFIRGLILLTHLGGHGGSQPGTFGRAMTHIIAGIFCINIYQFLQVMLSLFGISFS